MKQLGVLLLATLLAAPAAFGQTEAERERAAKHLQGTRQALVEATAGLSEAQWNFKPGPDRWSVAEIVEHLALSEDMLRSLVAERIMKTPAVEEQTDLKQGDEIVVTVVPDRSRKFQAPEPVQPTGRFGSGQNAMQHFLDSRVKTVEYVKTTPGLRTHAADSPFGQKFDAYQWVLFISAHVERHTKQLYEVKADPNYPTE